jgi:hypothetical protein
MGGPPADIGSLLQSDRRKYPRVTKNLRPKTGGFSIGVITIASIIARQAVVWLAEPASPFSAQVLYQSAKRR